VTITHRNQKYSDESQISEYPRKSKSFFHHTKYNIQRVQVNFFTLQSPSFQPLFPFPAATLNPSYRTGQTSQLQYGWLLLHPYHHFSQTFRQRTWDFLKPHRLRESHFQNFTSTSHKTEATKSPQVSSSYLTHRTAHSTLFLSRFPLSNSQSRRGPPLR